MLISTPITNIDSYDEIDSRSRSDDTLYHSLATSIETINFFRSKFEFVGIIKAAIDEGTHLDTLREMFLDVSSGILSSSSIDSILFGSQTEADNFYTGYNNRRTALINQDPIFSSLVDTISYLDSQVDDINFLFDNLIDIYTTKDTFLNSLGSYTIGIPAADVPCGSRWQIVKLAACATGCSLATSGVGTALCGWACWCMLCYKNSTVYDTIC